MARQIQTIPMLTYTVLSMLLFVGHHAHSCSAFSTTSGTQTIIRKNIMKSRGSVALRMFSNDGDNEAQAKSKDNIKMQTYNPLRLAVLKLGFTEPMWSSPLNYEKKDGKYECAYCGNTLFDSNAKYDSGSGWPSFWRSENDNSISYRSDFGRLEVCCGKCNSHLGHVFPDGPKVTNDAKVIIDPNLYESSPESDPRTKANDRCPRFCVNGASLRFSEGKDETESS